MLLTALQDAGTLTRYVPFDVSDEFLRDAADTLADEFTDLDMHLVIGDFHHHLGGDPDRRPPGGRVLGRDDREPRPGPAGPLPLRPELHDVERRLPLLGTDLVKDRARLVAAYDDSAGVTAAFNRNVLHVLNQQLGGNFDPDRFRHVAVWNEDEQWIEMRLRADGACEVSLADAGISVRFEEGEDLLTEISAKFTPERVEAELEQAGFVVEEMWGAEDGEFLLTLAHPYC